MRNIKLLNVTDHDQECLIRVAGEVFGRPGLDVTDMIPLRATVVEDVLYVHVGRVTLSLLRDEVRELFGVNLDAANKESITCR